MNDEKTCGQDGHRASQEGTSKGNISEAAQGDLCHVSLVRGGRREGAGNRTSAEELALSSNCNGKP